MNDKLMTEANTDKNGPQLEVEKGKDVHKKDVDQHFKTFYGVLFAKDCHEGSCELLKFSYGEEEFHYLKKSVLQIKWDVKRAEPISDLDGEHTLSFISAFRASPE